MLTRLSRCLQMTMLMMWSSCLYAANDITLDIYVAEAPPTVKVLAGYGTLTNTGEDSRVIINVTSDDFSVVEMHESVLDGDVARMRPIRGLTLPAGGEVVQLEPGHRHLMLIRPTRPLRAGDEVTLAFTFASGDVITTRAPVKRSATGTAHQHHHNH